MRIALSRATAGDDAGQLVNMLFGNTSLQEDVVLQDAEFPPRLVAGFGGPHFGLAGLRERAGAAGRALTCTALKPQGLTPARLADLAARFARGGIDYIKDDHGLADQAYSPFAARCEAVAAALRRSNRRASALRAEPDRRSRCAARPDRCGEERRHRHRDGAADDHGPVEFCQLVAENPRLAFFAHPTLAGAARIAPPFLFGKIFRMLGADALVFPNHGGRFGYSPETCGDRARTRARDWHGLRPRFRSRPAA